MKTLTITNLGGPLTRRNTGDINSGLAKFDTSWGYDPYSKPGNLTWMEQPTSILTLIGSAGPILAMKQRTESANNFAYAVANNRNLYRIQISTVSAPNLDSPSIIGALINIGGDNEFNNGSDMEFYGATEKIFISGQAIQKINFDGSGVASIASTEFSNTPKPLATFLGKLYFGNQNNIGEIDSTELVVTTGKLSPALPSGLYVRDLDATPDGNYLQITATRGALEVNPLGTEEPGVPMAESYKFYWNGIDSGITSSEYFSGTRLVASELMGDENNTFGYEQSGTAVFSGKKKVLVLPNNIPPFTEATFGISDMLGFATEEYVQSDTRYRGAVYTYGQYDNETQKGLYRLLRFNAATAGSDVVTVPVCKNVSNLVYSHPYRGATGSIASAAKLYITTTEASALGSPVGPHRLLRFPTTPIGTGSIVAGVYETQNQLFSKKVKLGEVRFYTEPLVADNAFTLAILNSGSSIMAQNTYTVGTNVTAGEDLIRFKPEIAPTQAVGFRITNSGSANWTGLKLETDYENAGT